MKAKAEVKSQKSQPEIATGTPTLVHSANSESSSILTQEDLKVLKAPFPKDSLGVKVQSTSKDRTRALLVLYLQHTDVQDRLEMVDPAWTSEVINEERIGDTVYVRIRMTVKGVSRENVGEGNDPKAAYSDALKRAAMLFGVGRYLYDSPTVWAEYNESRDRFRQWSIQDYEKNIKGSYVTPSPAAEPRETRESSAPSRSSEFSRPEPRSESRSAPRAEPRSEAHAEPRTEARSEGPGLTTKVPSGAGASTKEEKSSKGKSSARSREQLNRVLMNLYRPYLTKFPETRFVELLQSRYNVGETRLMTLEQIEDLVSYMEQQLSSAA